MELIKGKLSCLIHILFQIVIYLSIVLYLVSNSFIVSFDIGDLTYTFSSNLLVIASIFYNNDNFFKFYLF